MPLFYTDDKIAQVGITVTFVFLVIVDLIGNTLVIMIITCHKSMRTPMNYLLINLAISDIMVAIFIAPRFIFIHVFNHPDKLPGTLLCKLLTGGNLMWTGGAASVFSLLAVSFERYYAVIQPYTHKSKLSVKKVKTVVIACWVFAIILNIPLFITIFNDKKKKFCMEEWPNNAHWLALAYSLTWFIVAGVLPVTTMIVLYSRVINNLWFKKVSQEMEATQLAVIKSRKKVTKMVVIVSIIYALCWLPYLTVYMLNNFNPGNTYGDVTYVSTIVLVTCNSAINPFVYTFQNEKFKKHMQELICGRHWCGCNRVEPSCSSSKQSSSYGDHNNTSKNTNNNNTSKSRNERVKCESENCSNRHGNL